MIQLTIVISLLLLDRLSHPIEKMLHFQIEVVPVAAALAITLYNFIEGTQFCRCLPLRGVGT
jgi:hypothetical protein